MAKKTFVVTHPKLYMSVKGKLAHVEKGTEVSMDEKHAASLIEQGKILVKGEGKSVDIGGEKKLTAAQKKKLTAEVSVLEEQLSNAETDGEKEALSEELQKAKEKLA